MKTPNLDKAIEGYISYTIKTAQQELSKTRSVGGRTFNRVSSGKLKNSLFGVSTKKNKKRVISFGSTASYAKQIEYGVNGTKKKWNSPYSFKGENIDTSWVANWANRKGIKVDGDMTINGLKYVIGRSIARNGIIPVPYFRLAVEAAEKKFNNNIFNAYIKDVDAEIDKKLK